MVRVKTVEDLRSVFPKALPPRVRLRAHASSEQQARDIHRLVLQLHGVVISTQSGPDHPKTISILFAIDPGEVPTLLLQRQFVLEIDDLATTI